MKSQVAILAALVLGQVIAQAQGQPNFVNQAGSADGAVIVPAQPNAQAEVQVQQQPAPQNPIYILNNQRYQGYQGTSQQAHVGQTAVQEQPVSVVQDTPLKTSPADMLRKKRQESESATEDGIVQSLERARMDDEMRRRDKFNNAIAPVVSESAASGTGIVGNGNTVQQTNVLQSQQVVPAPMAAPVAAPVPMRPTKKVVRVIEEHEEAMNDNDSDFEDRSSNKKDKVDIRGEIRAAIEETNKKDEDKGHNYVSGMVSFGQYDRVVNINPSLGYGVAVGTQTAERFIAEGTFIYGAYELEDIYGTFTYGYPMKVDMTQYNVAAAAKYAILPGKFRPLIGAVLSYTRRSYSSYGYEFRTSDAVDAGALFGADLQLSSNFAIGVDFRYMTNLGYRQNLNQNQSFTYSRRKNDPERLDYYTFNVLAKFLF